MLDSKLVRLIYLHILGSTTLFDTNSRLYLLFSNIKLNVRGLSF